PPSGNRESASSTPGIRRAPQNGHGYVSVGCPTSSGTGTGNGSRPANRGSTAISRATPGTATARRGNRNTHCPPTTWTVLSHPVASGSTGAPRRSGNCAPIRAAASAGLTTRSGTHSDKAVLPLLVQRGVPAAARDQLRRRSVLHDPPGVQDQYP